MTPLRLPVFARLPVLVLAFSLSSLAAADSALSSLVQKFTEKRAAQAAPLPAAQPIGQTAAQTVAPPAKLGPEPAKTGGRKPSPPLASLPAPKASGPLRILLVDDDASSNNAGGDTGAAQRSDGIFRDLVAKAVGGSADAWSVEVVKNRDNGPAFERLRGFNVVLWYTGASYGANNDTIGREDEKTLRRYLEETGGAVILVSPGYLNNLVYGQSWEAAEHPFLKEVLAVNGCYGLVQRATRGTVRAHNGTEFPIEHPGAAETQFSVVNPDGAALVFTSPLETTYAKAEAGGGLPVAVANAYGTGRIVYLGFTFENIPAQDRARAFALLLEAATGPTAGRPVAANPAPSASPGGRTITQLPPGGTGPATLSKRPAGPPPQNLSLEARPNAITGSPGHLFRWDGNSEPQRHFLFRKDGDAWNVVDRNPADGAYISDGFGATFRYGLFLEGRWIYPGTQFKVLIDYQDGREGEAEITYNNPEMLLRVATDLRAVQTGYRKIRVTWKRPLPIEDRGRGAGGTLFAAGLPQGSVSPLATDSPDVYIGISNVPEGRHPIHVAFHGMTRLLPNDARGVAEVLPVMGNRIRVVLLGFRVGRKTTDDDIFDGDGRGDEVYFTAYRANIPLRNRPAGVAPLGIVQSAVIGDTNNFPSRQRGGNAGPTGGVRSGDAVPSESALAAQPGIAANRDRLPMILWEGKLDREYNATVVALTGWEWDVSPAVPADAWSSRWDQQWTKDRLFDIASSAAIDTPDEIRYQPLSAPDVRQFYGASSTRGGTRPLGGLMAGPGTWDCVPLGIVLTLRNVESLLGNAAAAVINAPLSSMRRSPVAAWDDPNQRDASDYTAVLQIERLPMTAAEISDYTGPWVPDLRYATPPPSSPPAGKKGGSTGKKRG